MIKAYIKMWKNVFNYSGRSQRRDYWLAVLANLIIGFVLIFVTTLILISAIDPKLENVNTAGILGLFNLLLLLVMLVPGIALGVRRLHDTGKSGWWVLIGMIPYLGIIGGIFLIVFFCEDSGPDNKYGPNPKKIAKELEL